MAEGCGGGGELRGVLAEVLLLDSPYFGTAGVEKPEPFLG